MTTNRKPIDTFTRPSKWLHVHLLPSCCDPLDSALGAPWAVGFLTSSGRPGRGLASFAGPLSRCVLNSCGGLGNVRALRYTAFYLIVCAHVMVPSYGVARRDMH